VSGPTKPRNGIREKRRDATGRTYFLGKIYLQGSSDPRDLVRLRIPDDKRYSDTASRNWLAYKQEQEDLHGTLRKAREAGEAKTNGPVARPGVETVRKWFARFHDWCENVDGQRTVKTRRQRFNKWIDPIIGHLAMAGAGRVDREGVRAVVAKLDEQIALRAAYYRDRGEDADEHEGSKPGLSAKTAANIWGELTGGFKEACTSKVNALRARDAGDNPTRDVQPPNKSDDREQAALYPNEVIALLSCEDVPLYRRELYALSIYSGMRQGESRGLVAGDVDFEHDVINIRRQRKARKGTSKTKTRAGIRQVPIHPRLRPLLQLLVNRATIEHERRKATDPNAAPGPLVHVPPVEDCAERVREDLRKAGCTRDELYRDDEDRYHFTFHGLRHTCLTHWAVAGTPLPLLMSWAGHADMHATQDYLDLGAILRGQRFGEPHPEIPGSLLQTTMQTTDLGAPTKRVYRTKQKGRNHEGFSPNSHGALVTPVGIEPALPA
jgi:integrase